MKNFYYIYLDDEFIGQTWARSEEEAKKNVWWKRFKNGDKYVTSAYDPSDLEALQIR